MVHHPSRPRRVPRLSRSALYAIAFVALALATPLGATEYGLTLIDAPIYDDSPVTWAAPFNAISRHPLRLTLLDPLPVSALPTVPGNVRITPMLEYSSFMNWQNGRTLPPNSDLQMAQFDGELANVSLAIEVSLPWRAPGGELRLGGRFDLHHMTGGFLDDELTAYHELLQLPNLGREDHPSDRFRANLYDNNGNLAWQSNSGGIKGGNLQLYAIAPLWRGHLGGDDAAIAIRLATKIPLGSSGYGLDAGGMDYSAGVLASWRSGDFGIDANADYVKLGDFDFRGASGYAVEDYVKLMLGVQWQAFDRVWAMAQVAASSSPFTSPVPLRVVAQDPILLTFGVSFELDGMMLSFSTAEDLTYSEIDFTFALSVTFGF